MKNIYDEVNDIRIKNNQKWSDVCELSYCLNKK